jgi:hypothetical protein
LQRGLSYVTIKTQSILLSCVYRTTKGEKYGTKGSNYAKKSQEDVEAINKKKEWKYSSLRPIYGIYIVLANEFEDEDAPDYVKQACEVADYQGLEKEEVDMVSARERASKKSKN